MSETKPSRNSKQSEHNQYGINNWFKSKGITDAEVIDKIIYDFCEREGFTMEKITIKPAVCKFIQNRFLNFGAFAMKALRKANLI